MGRKFTAGFTLLELMVVVSVVAILAAVITANLMEAKAKARDTERQANIRELKSAIELYKNKYGEYPSPCETIDGENGISTSAKANWAGQIGSIYACDDGSNNYIVDLAPEFIQTLPVDKKVNNNTNGYVYTTNSDRTIYKLKAKGTVETERVGYTHPLKSCDIRSPSNEAYPYSLIDTNFERAGICSRVSFAGNNIAPACIDSPGGEWRTSYGAWGGFAELGKQPQVFARYARTAEIICR